MTSAGGMERPPRALARPGVLYADDRLTIWSTNVRWVRLRGEIDMTNSQAVADALADAQGPADLLIVDVGRLRFIDLSGLRALGLLPSASPRCRLRLVNMPPFMKRLLAALYGTIV